MFEIKIWEGKITPKYPSNGLSKNKKRGQTGHYPSILFFHFSFFFLHLLFHLGKLALHMKETLPVAMRIPKWADLKQVKITVDGKPREVKWNGQYAELGEVKSGQTAVAEFPVTERTAEYNMGDYTVKYTIRGNTVVSMTPPGKVCPLYQNREGMRDPKVKVKTIKRYVPEADIDL